MNVHVSYERAKTIRDVVNERKKRLRSGSVENYVVRLERFLKRAKSLQDDRVLIVGDYDADGISASYVAYSYLKRLGFKPLVYVPLRKHGYGVRGAVFEKGIRNVVVVDSGTNFDFRPYDGSYNVMVIDHHQARWDVKEAIGRGVYETVEVINPFLEDDEQNKPLCAAGLTYNLFSRYCGENEELMQVATVATVADVVPVLGSTHWLLKRGFASINEKGYLNGGLREIALGKGVKFATYKSIGFGIAPVINATGRIGCGSLAFNLLRKQDRHLARKALSMNDKRRRIQRELELIAKNNYHYDGDYVFLSFGSGYEQGVVGIVASKISKEKRKFTIIGREENGVVRFSGRNPFEGVNAVKLLDRLSDYLIGFGGHEKAFGGEIEVEYAMEFATELDFELRRIFSKRKDDEIVIDARVQDVSLKEVEEGRVLYPFGPENEPLTIETCIRVHNTTQNEYGYVVYAKTEASGNPLVLFSDEPLSVGAYDVVFSVDFNVNLNPVLRIVHWKRSLTSKSAKPSCY